jgi:hypothetical protein
MKLTLDRALSTDGLCLGIIAAVLLGTNAQAQTPGMVQFFDAGKVRKGMLLVEMAQEMVIIGRDGWMHSVDPHASETQFTRLKEN